MFRKKSVKGDVHTEFQCSVRFLDDSEPLSLSFKVFMHAGLSLTWPVYIFTKHNASCVTHCSIKMLHSLILEQIFCCVSLIFFLKIFMLNVIALRMMIVMDPVHSESQYKQRYAWVNNNKSIEWYVSVNFNYRYQIYICVWFQSNEYITKLSTFMHWKNSHINLICL